ncbi:MAG: YiiX/YebB-like N1pC/P60 family cysteine hydrolase [Candidatus Heimdallarchaeaceae archaeon]
MKKKNLVLPFVLVIILSSTVSSLNVQSYQADEDRDEIKLEAFKEVNDNEKEISFTDDGTNSLNYNGLVPGDIILLGTDGTFFDYLIPGEFSHTVIFAGFVQSGEQIWDRDNHQWMAPGTPYVIHSTKSDNAGNGIGYSTWSVAVNEHAERAVAIRVNGLTDSQRQQAVNWMKDYAGDGTNPEAYPYDWGWTTKQIYGTSSVSGINGWYCSELAWAAYKDLFGIDLDPDGSSWSWETAYGVSPSDLYEDGDTEVVETSDWDPSQCYYVKVNLVGIYYEDDYDPWPKGAGEEYLKWFVGDGWGGTGYVIEDFYGTVSRDGSGYIYWKVTLADVLIPKTHPLKIRVEAWEDDSWPDSDDQYQVFNWWTDYMLDFVNTGWWWWNYVDLGDVRYCIEFCVSTSPIGVSPNGI